jgi:hypothetical protein
MVVVVPGNRLEEQEMVPTIELKGKRRVEVRHEATETMSVLLLAKSPGRLRDEHKV